VSVATRNFKIKKRVSEKSKQTRPSNRGQWKKMSSARDEVEKSNEEAIDGLVQKRNV